MFVCCVFMGECWTRFSVVGTELLYSVLLVACLFELAAELAFCGVYFICAYRRYSDVETFFVPVFAFFFYLEYSTRYTNPRVRCTFFLFFRVLLLFLCCFHGTTPRYLVRSVSICVWSTRRRNRKFLLTYRRYSISQTKGLEIQGGDMWWVRKNQETSAQYDQFWLKEFKYI